MAVRVINHQREDGTWTGMVAVIGREPGIGNQDGTCLGLGNQLGSPHIIMDGVKESSCSCRISGLSVHGESIGLLS